MIRHVAILSLLVASRPLSAQTFAAEDPVLRRIWSLGMDSSQAGRLMQVLTDSIGPRLTATPGMVAGQDWLVATYTTWGVNVRKERYGTWIGWRRGLTHVDLLAPRVRALEGMLLAWSGGTRGRPVEAATITLPELADSAGFNAWLPSVKGRFVLLSHAEPTCRPDSAFRQFALPDTWARLREQRARERAAWNQRLARTGQSARDLPRRVEAAGAAGILTSRWSEGWGVNKIFNGRTTNIPTLDLSCEDYGLVYRLTENGQSPRLRITADAEFQGDVPVFNVIAEIRGREKPDEYVMLSAHFDSWDGSSGATDNGTGSITMLEAMRILARAYPSPKRTILVGHWSGEEQGLIGSRAFAEDHPEIVSGLQALFNQDNGTGRIVNVSAAGLLDAGPFLARWFARVPSEISRHANFSFPGTPSGGGSDNASFACYGAPAFGLGSLGWEYGTYTWHTNRDTYDKVVLDELKNNATLVAMLVYQASEEPERIPRAQRILPRTPQGQEGRWPTCSKPARSFGEWTR
ncbi:MAG TPA: M20/M25/M40 family metallo-hydrolase [Gemmatimonadales bacterium]